MILVERRDIAREYGNRELTLTADTDLDWRKHPVVLTQTQLESFQDISRVLLILSKQQHPPTQLGGAEPGDNSILRTLDREHEIALHKYRFRIIKASENDKLEIEQFKSRYDNLQHKVGAGTAAAGAALGGGSGAAIGSVFGPIGTLAGAGLGALIGAIAGGISGSLATESLVSENFRTRSSVHRFTALQMIDLGECERIEDIKTLIDNVARPLFLNLRGQVANGEMDQDQLQELQQLVNVRNAFFPRDPLVIEQRNVHNFLSEHNNNE